MEEIVILILLVKIVGFTIPIIVMWFVLREKKKSKYAAFKKYWEHEEVAGNYYDVLVEENPGIVPKKVTLN